MAWLGCALPAHRAFAQARHPELWIAPLQPYERKDGSKAGAVDYFGLFHMDAAWADTARHTTVFKIYPELLRSSSDDQLRTISTDLKQRHILLGLETKILTQTGWCGPNADHSPWMVGLVQRLKRLGAELNSVSMVGPLVDGHVSQQPGSCHRPIPEVAADAAHTVGMMRQIYPDLVVGEIEPVGSGPGFPSADELGQWLTAFQHASGSPVAFLHVDTVWGTAWREDMRAIAHEVQASNVRFGVIYKADPTELSDAAFAAATLAHADATEALLGGPPSQVIVQSWEDYPRHAMPDNDMSSLTGIARAYLRPHTSLAPVGVGKVKLAAEDGTPIAGAEIVVELHRPDTGVALVPQTIEGVVPHKAASALFAVRVHAECTCTSRQVSLAMTNLRFRQAGQPDVKWDMAGWGKPAGVAGATDTVRIDAAAGQKLILNGPRFAVMADQPFVAQFDWQVPSSGQDAGFAALIFQSADGTEIRRTVHPLQPSWQATTTLTTGPDGVASVPVPSLQPGLLVRLDYQGDLAHRPVILPMKAG